MTITAAEALPDFHTWSTFAGPIMYFGPWDDAYGPVGDLVLVVRDGKPVTG